MPQEKCLGMSQCAENMVEKSGVLDTVTGEKGTVFFSQVYWSILSRCPG